MKASQPPIRAIAPGSSGSITSASIPISSAWAFHSAEKDCGLPSVCRSIRSCPIAILISPPPATACRQCNRRTKSSSRGRPRQCLARPKVAIAAARPWLVSQHACRGASSGPFAVHEDSPPDRGSAHWWAFPMGDIQPADLAQRAEEPHALSRKLRRVAAEMIARSDKRRAKPSLIVGSANLVQRLERGDEPAPGLARKGV